jgi:ferric-dicitrate binding protein FerR (iron transport regulator)
MSQKVHKLDQLVRESRPDLGTREAREVDWARVDQELFRRIDAERQAQRAQLSSRPGRWTMVAGGLAAAAALALVVGKVREPRPTEVPRVVVDETAGSVVAIEGGGQLLVGGKPVAVGSVLHLGDAIEARGAQATVERAGKLTLVIERETRATVTHVQGSLVVALAEGALEAQVVPVPNGEAFAVDVGLSRVAVHGTHLRVARSGEHVVVDLNEGVVSLGPAPRIGSTLGSLVTAPAHAEFGASDAEGSLTMTHDPSVVRPALASAVAAQARPSTPEVAASPSKSEVAEARPSGAPGAVPHAEGHPGASSPQHVATTADPDPQGTIASAVRACLSERPRADNVTVEVSTVVRLDVDADGTVLHARFDPPVTPDVNACAAGPIYRTRFAHGGSVAVPVEFRVPSSAP